MIMGDISRIGKRMRVLAERQFAAHDLGYPEQVVIMHLIANGSCKQEAIAQSLDVDKGSIAKTLTKLEAKGLVVREVNPLSKREKIVTLTPAATQLVDSLRESHMTMSEVMFKGMSDEEIKQLTSGLAKVAANLKSMERDDR